MSVDQTANYSNAEQFANEDGLQLVAKIIAAAKAKYAEATKGVEESQAAIKKLQARSSVLSKAEADLKSASASAVLVLDGFLGSESVMPTDKQVLTRQQLQGRIDFLAAANQRLQGYLLPKAVLQKQGAEVAEAAAEIGVSEASEQYFCSKKIIALRQLQATEGDSIIVSGGLSETASALVIASRARHAEMEQAYNKSRTAFEQFQQSK